MNTTTLYFLFLHSALSEMLQQEEPVKVQFVKKDGSVRDMDCTLNADVINADEKLQPSVGNDNVPTHPNLMRVVDVQKGEWRSFYTSDLLTINGIGVLGWVSDYASDHHQHAFNRLTEAKEKENNAT